MKQGCSLLRRSVFNVLPLLLFMLAFNANAQVSAYTFASSSGTYTPIAGTVMGSTSTDDLFFNNDLTGTSGSSTNTGFPIGFNFVFNGTTYDKFAVCSNGWMKLGTGTFTIGGNGSIGPMSNTATAGYEDMIVAVGIDLQGQSGSSISYEMVGTAPNRVLVVQWSGYRRYGNTIGSDNLNFQIRLNETSNTVEIIYGTMTISSTESAQVGIRGLVNTDFNNRTTTTNWAATTAGTTNAAANTLSSTVFPASGLTYIWSSLVYPVDMRAVALVSPVAGGCFTAAETVTISIINLGSSTIDFSVDPVTVNASVTGPNAMTFTPVVVNSGTLAPNATQNVVVDAAYNMSAAGTYIFNASTNVAGDGNTANDAMPAASRTVIAPVTIPYLIDFNSTANYNTPTGWSGNMYALGNHGTANSSGLTYNIYSSSPTATGIAPKAGPITAYSFLKFDYRIVNYTSYPSTATTLSAGDNIIIEVSTDCGQTFTTFQTIDNLNHVTSMSFANMQYSLAAYAGQDIIVRLLLNWGAGDYYVDIDNFQIVNLPPVDMSATALAAPVTGGCYTSTETVSVTVTNVGSQPMDFSVNPLTVNASVTGVNPVTFAPVIINTGTLAVGATQNVVVSTSYDMTAAGTYTFNASTSVAADGQTSNDAMTAVTITTGAGTAAANITTVCSGSPVTLTLTGYNGTIQWQVSTDGGTTWVNATGTGNTSDTYTASPTVNSMYQAVVCGTMNSNAVTVTVDNPPAPTVTGDTRCGTGTVNLSASGTGNLYWYDAATGGNVLTTGTTYSPTLSATTTFYVANSTGTPPSAHTTTFAAGNGSNGNMFAITALNTVTITGFDGHTTGGTSTWEIYYRPDDYTTVAGSNTSSTGWILLGTAANVPSAGTGLPTPIPVTFNVTIPAGMTYSFHVVTTAGTTVQYTNGTAVGAVYNSNTDFQFREGHGGTLFSCTNSPRIFNGRIHYNSGCQSARVPVTATVNPAPAITASSSSPAICAGGSATLSVTSSNAGYSYTWSPAGSLSSSTGASVTATPVTNTTYTVDALDAVSGCVNSTTVSLAVNPLPAGVTASSTAPEVCAGSTVDLSSTVTPNVSVYSETFETFPLTQLATGGSGVTAAQSTTYYSQGTSSVRLTYGSSANGNLAMTSDINLSSYAAPQLQFSHICATEGGYDYGYVQYSTDGGATWTSFPPSSYLGTGTLKNGVVSFDRTSHANWSSQITNSSSTPGTGPATALWQTETIDLSAYQSSTQFRVRFRLTSDGSVIYYGWLIDDLKITYQPSYTFNWTSSPTGFTSSTQNPTGVAPAANTDYTVTVTDPATSCSSTASVSVTVNPLPTVTATAAVATICEGGNTTLTASGADTYTWSPATGLSSTSGASVTAAPTVTTTYTVSGADLNGCINTASVTLNVNPLPVVTLAAMSDLCEDAAAVTITGESPSGGTFSGTGVSGNIFDPAVAGIGTHTITYSYTDGNSCTNTATASVTVNALPVVTLAAFTDECSNGSAITLTGESPSGGTFSGTGVSGGMFDPAVAGVGTHTITYDYTDANGCSSSATSSITVNTPPTVTLAAINPVCENAAVITLGGESPSGGTFSGNGVSGTTFDPAAAGAGTHDVIYTYTDANMCSNSDTASVLVYATPVVTLASQSAVCANSAAFMITGESPAGGTFSGTGVSGNMFDPAAAGAGMHDVIYTYTDANMCSNSDTATVTVNALPVITLATYTPVCEGAAAIALSGESPAGGAYSGTGVSGSSFDPVVAGPGVHYVVYSYTDNNSCTGIDSVAMTVNANPVVNLGADITQCGGSVTLNAGNSGSTYTWSTSDSQQMITVSSSGNYSVLVTDTNSCSASDTIMVTINAPAIVSLGSDTTICADNTLTLDAGAGFSSYMWSTNATTQTITVSTSGSYIVTVTNADGCQDSDTLMVTVDPCIGIAENGSSYVISVRPNPSEGIFNLVISGADIARLNVDILDIQGKLVYGFVENNISGEFVKEINLDGLAKGVYYLRMNTGTSVVTERLVIQ